MKKLLIAIAMLLAKDQSCLAQPAVFTFIVPPDAKVFVDRNPTTATSDTRAFRTGPLNKGRMYYYDVLVTLQRGDQEFTYKERVDFYAGDRIQRSFLTILDDAESKSYPRKFQIVRELRILDERNQQDVLSFIDSDRSNRILAELGVQEIARLDVRDRILGDVAQRPPLDLDANTVSDVTYERVGLERLKVVLEVHNSSKQFANALGRFAVRDTVRYHCTYRKMGADWALERYSSTMGDAFGDYLRRWENGLAMQPRSTLAIQGQP
ncbi:MAG: TIGR03000 domain-containing protein [Planctomycetota bacterium]